MQLWSREGVFVQFTFAQICSVKAESFEVRGSRTRHAEVIISWSPRGDRDDLGTGHVNPREPTEVQGTFGELGYALDARHDWEAVDRSGSTWCLESESSVGLRASEHSYKLLVI